MSEPASSRAAKIKALLEDMPRELRPRIARLLSQVAHDVNTPISTFAMEVFSMGILLAKLRRAASHPLEPASAAALAGLEDACANLEHAASQLTGYAAALANFESANAAPLAATTPTVPSVARRRGRVLVVDDEELIGELVAGAFAGEHEVTVSLCAQQALELLRADHRFDVIFCDLDMPQMSGMKLHAELLGFAPDLASRVVFLSGGATTPEARAFLGSSANLHVEKPFDMKHLSAILDAALLRTTSAGS